MLYKIYKTIYRQAESNICIGYIAAFHNTCFMYYNSGTYYLYVVTSFSVISGFVILKLIFVKCVLFVIY